MRKLRPCSGCSRHVRANEPACPFCHARVELADIQADASAVGPVAGARVTRAALVFAGATVIAACGGSKEDTSTSSASSASSTGGTSGSSGKSSSGSSGTSGTSGTSGSNGDTSGNVALYGPAPVDDGGVDNKDAGGGVPLYGPPPFDG
jgi:hypothetical protein